MEMNAGLIFGPVTDEAVRHRATVARDMAADAEIVIMN